MAVEYIVSDPSAARRGWQATRLAPFSKQVRWVNNIAELQQSGGVSGVIFANELLDAMPVKRLCWDAGVKQWQELGVGYSGEALDWQILGPARATDVALLGELPNELLALLPHGFCREVSPTAMEWWKNAAEGLNQGCLLTFDYGFEREEFFLPGRDRGTLRSYQGHRVSDDLLSEPGRKDLTAQVDYSLIRSTGEAAGLKTVAFELQGRFWNGKIAEWMRSWGETMPGWFQSEIRQLSNLTHPDHFGRAFRVLQQQRPG
jgi:SAM-dependent MidA family methyltransferase